VLLVRVLLTREGVLERLQASPKFNHSSAVYVTAQERKKEEGRRNKSMRRTRSSRRNLKERLEEAEKEKNKDEGNPE
jgi:hypothetical protein